MKRALLSFSKSFYSFLFPPFCIACGEKIEEGRKTVCSSCFSSLTLLSKEDRCPVCFRPHFETTCSYCLQRKPLYKSLGVCFDESFVVHALLAFLAEQKNVQALASFCLLQLDALQIPAFTVVIPTPGDFFSYGDDRYKERKLIAKEIAKLLHCRYKEVSLKRHRMKNPYSSLEGYEGDDSPVYIRDPSLFRNERILLFHDIVKTGEAFNHTAKALSSFGCDQVFALSLMTAL